MVLSGNNVGEESKSALEWSSEPADRVGYVLVRLQVVLNHDKVRRLTDRSSMNLQKLTNHQKPAHEDISMRSKTPLAFQWIPPLDSIL